MSGEERIAALEAQVASLTTTVNILVESTRRAPGGPTMIDAYFAEEKRTASLRERAARYRAIVKMPADQRSAAVLEMSAHEVVSMFGVLSSNEEKAAFARDLDDAAWEKLVASINRDEFAPIAFALAEPVPYVRVSALPGVSVRTRGFGLDGGFVIMPRAEWEQRLASDADLRRAAEGHPGTPYLHFPSPPRLAVTDLSADESRREAMRLWFAASPRPSLPPRAARA